MRHDFDAPHFSGANDPEKKCSGYMDKQAQTKHEWSECSISDMNSYLTNNCLEPLSTGIQVLSYYLINFYINITFIVKFVMYP